MGVNFFPAKKTKPGGGSEGCLVKDHTFAAFFFVHPSLTNKQIYNHHSYPTFQREYAEENLDFILRVERLNNNHHHHHHDYHCYHRHYGIGAAWSTLDDAQGEFTTARKSQEAWSLHLLLHQ